MSDHKPGTGHLAKSESDIQNNSYPWLGVDKWVNGRITMAAGWFVKTNQLRVIVDREWLITERRAFGRTFRKLAARTIVSGFDKKVTMQSGQGAQAEIYYSILAQKTDGQTLAVGDHIHGQEDADVLLEFFRRHVAVEAGSESRTSTGQLPVPPQIRWIIAGVKALSVLIFIGMMAAFIVDFSA